MSDVVINNGEDGIRHRLPLPSDIGELRKLHRGFLSACERQGRPIEHDDEVVVTVEGGSLVLTRVDPADTPTLDELVEAAKRHMAEHPPPGVDAAHEPPPRVFCDVSRDIHVTPHRGCPLR